MDSFRMSATYMSAVHESPTSSGDVVKPFTSTSITTTTTRSTSPSIPKEEVNWDDEFEAAELAELNATFDSSVLPHLSRMFAPTKILGEGGQAVVLAVRHRKLDTEHVIKCFRSPDIAKRRMFMEREVYCLGALRGHANIASSIWLDHSGEGGDISNLVLDMANGGDLLGLRDRATEARRLLPESMLWSLMRQMLSAVAYTHRSNIIHADIKLDNWIVEYPPCGGPDGAHALREPKIKLIDFGIAQAVPGSKVHCHVLRDDGKAGGTHYYWPPERVFATKSQRDSHQFPDDTHSCSTRAGDIWALGMCMQVLATGVVGCSTPIRDNQPFEMSERIVWNLHEGWADKLSYYGSWESNIFPPTEPLRQRAWPRVIRRNWIGSARKTLERVVEGRSRELDDVVRRNFLHWDPERRVKGAGYGELEVLVEEVGKRMFERVEVPGWLCSCDDGMRVLCLEADGEEDEEAEGEEEGRG